MTQQETSVIHPASQPRASLHALVTALLFLLPAAALAQNPLPGTTAPPVVDSAPAGPTTSPPAPPVVDAAAEASPTPPTAHGAYIPANSSLSIRLNQSADSAHVRNGDLLKATLASPVMASHGKRLPAGTTVGLTVLAVSAAGKLHSRGEITLQVVRVGTIRVLSDAVTVSGKTGHKDLPDSAPEKGTEATLASGSTLQFKVPPIPKQ